MRISDWSSDVCSSDLAMVHWPRSRNARPGADHGGWQNATCINLLDSCDAGVLPDSWPRRSRSHCQGDRAPPVFPWRTISHHQSKCHRDRKSVVLGKSVYVREDLGGGRIINKKKK